MKIALEGVTGSRAYGLDTPESDEDRVGVFVRPTAEILGVLPHTDGETVVQHDPDRTYHELRKFVSLALAGNPTILECLFLDDYTVLEPIGRRLVEHRTSFLSDRIRLTYGGYALAQFRRLKNRGDGSFSADTRNRTAKHARHCARLIQQGRQLRETGSLSVRVTNRDELFELGELAVRDVDALERWVRQAIAGFDAVETVLPPEPDLATVNEILLSARLADLQPA